MNKVAVITGGSSGIGKATAIELKKRGLTVYELSRRDSDIPGIIHIKADVTDGKSVSDAIDRVISEQGRIDILINNAGINRDKLLISMKEEDFDEVIGVDLKGEYNMTRRVAPILIRKRAGKIINISSVAGLDGNPGQANYSAAKAGLIGLTKTLAKEFASRNICVNAIAPGFIATDMTVGLEEAAKAVPLGRMGRPEEVAALAVFLAGADYITGEVIRIDGGL